jgi:hypothetical protein
MSRSFVDSGVDIIVFQIDSAKSTLENFLVYLHHSEYSFDDILSQSFAPVKTSPIFTFLAVSGQTFSFLKGVSIIQSEDPLSGNAVLKMLHEIHAECMTTSVNVLQVVQLYTVYSDFDFEALANHHLQAFSSFIEDRFGFLKSLNPAYNFHTQSSALTKPAESRKKIIDHLTSWKLSQHSSMNKFVADNVCSFLISGLNTGYMIPSVLSAFIDVTPFDDLIESQWLVLYRIYELRTWEIISDVFLDARTDFPGHAFSELAIRCLKQFEKSLSCFASEYPGLGHYLNELSVTTMSTIFELAVKSFSFDVAREYLLKLAENFIGASSSPTPLWKSCVREYIRESARAGMMSELIDLHFPNESFLELFLRELEVVVSFGIDIGESMETNDFEPISSLFLRPSVNSRFPRMGWIVLLNNMNANSYCVNLEMTRYSFAHCILFITLDDQIQRIYLD